MTVPKTTPRIYSIPAGLAFADVLAEGLWWRAEHDPLKLGRGIVLVPHRRAARVLADAFLRIGDGQAMLLPEIRAVGDVDEDEPFGDPAMALDAEGAEGCPPAISPLRRQLLLTRLVMLYLERTGADASARAGAALDGTAPDQAARLAVELARLLDQMQTEAVDFDQLANLVPDIHARHWQQTLSFLAIVTEAWPKILREEGAVDPATRRNRLLGDLAGRWARDRPDRPITIAGSTGSVPATAELMRVIVGLPDGAVVLPGLDWALDEDSWRAATLDTAHPQHALAGLLERLDLPRRAVAEWRFTTNPSSPREPRRGRQRLLSEAMRPATTTNKWRDLSVKMIEPGDLAGLNLIDCANVQEEAGVIALLLRETLETSGRTAALITPDRALARRVKSELRRWGIDIDDSAGQALADTPTLAFWRLVGAMVAGGLAPVPLLAALKHPLAFGGLAAGGFRRHVRTLERAVLRGPRPAPGVDGLLLALREPDEAAADPRGNPVSAERRAELAAWLETFAPVIRHFSNTIGSPSIALRDLLLAHNDLVEKLAAGQIEDGPSRLWAGDEGRQAAEFLGDLYTVAEDWPEMRGADYLALLDALLADKIFRPRHGAHPRLAILGPLEGRLQHYDRVVLGGLNEGTWPPEPAADPWLSRPMRAALGLPLPEVRIGQSAHDFVQACGAPEVYITRAERVDGTPTVPSRWLLRIFSVLDALDLPGALRDPDADWRGWQARMDAPERSTRRPPPAPRPPVADRPRSFSVTQIGTWLRNPYAIYARRILNLAVLDPLDNEPGAADRGSFIHQALDDFIRSGPPEQPDQALESLLRHGRRAFGTTLSRPAVWAFWWPRFEKIARWFIAIEAIRAPGIARAFTEIKGSITLSGAAGPVELRAIADRIDQRLDGDWTIVDYKTGAIPNKAEVDAGLAPQLPLESLILRQGGFEGLPAGRSAALEYWRLTGGEPAGETRAQDQRIEALVEAAEIGLLRLIAEFDNPETPYLAIPDPSVAPRFDDYAHLARAKEWMT